MKSSSTDWCGVDSDHAVIVLDLVWQVSKEQELGTKIITALFREIVSSPAMNSHISGDIDSDYANLVTTISDAVKSSTKVVPVKPQKFKLPAHINEMMKTRKKLIQEKSPDNKCKIKFLNAIIKEEINKLGCVQINKS